MVPQHFLVNFAVAILLSMTLLYHGHVGMAAKSTSRGHPKLFFGAEDVQTLRNRAATTHRFLAKRVVRAKSDILSKSWGFFPPISVDKFASRWNEVYGNNLPVLGLYVLLYPNDSQALNSTIEYMQRMAAYPSWYVASAPTDEVPVSHSLLGFATAFDFIHPYLNTYQRQAFQAKIVNQTALLYQESRRRWWGKADIQNHVFTNYLALFVGALLSRGWRDEAEPWFAWAKARLENNMDLLRNIQDGSLHEGVGYGGYSARSLTQYVVLAHRHCAINHFKHPWLKQHFNFYYYTTLPGFTKSVGIADTNANWFYGPESQLVFLDTFVMRKGWANWLARAIRNKRTEDQPKNFHYVTLHTEFLWYDSNIGEVLPPKWTSSVAHLFQDWGVATLRLGNLADPLSSSFFLKSGHVFGRAFYTRIKQGFKPIATLNSGHEHTDQNTIIIFMNGMTVFSDDLYNYKYSHTNNVLLFGPSRSSTCTPGWAGQIGDCRKWNIFNKSHKKLPFGEAREFQVNGNHVMSGEAATAYPDDLHLKCFTRFLVTLDKNLAVIIDYVSLHDESVLEKVSAFFNNHERRFSIKGHLPDGLEGLKISGQDKQHCEVWWKDHTQQSPVVSLSLVPPSNMSNVNITWDFQSLKYLTVAYVVSCNQPSIKSFNVVETSKGNFVLAFTILSSLYTLKLEMENNKCPNVSEVTIQNHGLSESKMSDNLVVSISNNQNSADLETVGGPVCRTVSKLLIVIIVIILIYLDRRVLSCLRRLFPRFTFY